MFFMTKDQERVLSVLEKTGCLRTDQAAKLLGDAKGEYTERVLRQLRYMQMAYFKTETVVMLPHLSGHSPDVDIRSAVDVMLGIAGGSLLALSSDRPPHKLCVLTDDKNGVGSYAVITVPEGSEQLISFQSNTPDADKRTLILLLESLDQQEKINIRTPHFFTFFDGKYRYFEGK